MAVVKGGYNLINLQNKDLATGSFKIPGFTTQSNQQLNALY